MGLALAEPVTRKRIRAYAVLIAVSLWSIWLIDMSRPGPVDRLGKVKGTDFIHFYVIGSIARDGAWAELFDARAQYARTRALVDPPPIYLPVESPQSALVMAPVTRLSYTMAFAAWTIVILAAYAAACWMLWRTVPALHRYRVEMVAACAAFPGLFSVVLHGQTSFVVLACVVSAIVAFRRGLPFAAGVGIGCLVFKPHWLAAAGAVLLFAGEWRALAGAAVAGAAQTALAGLVVGMPVMTAYAGALRSVSQIAELLEPHSSDSLRGLFTLLVPLEPLALMQYFAASVAVLIVAARTWRSAAPFELRAAAFVAATLLVSPHVNTYDLVLLGPVVWLTTAWLLHADEDARTTALGWLLAVLFVAPLLNSLPPLIRMQVTVTPLVAVLILIRRIAAEAETAPDFLHAIVPARFEWPTMALPSTSGNASVATHARLPARPSTKSPSASIAAG